MASSQDAWYLSLLGLAEYFRTNSPANIKACIQCLQAVFNFKPPPRVEARTHLQLGNILLVHTKNVDLARIHLEKAWELSQAISSFDDVRFEAASMLAELFVRQQQQKWAKDRLRQAIEMSQSSCYWHCRLLFQLAQIHALEKDFVSACSLLGVGVEFTALSGAHYTRILFLLSKIMLLLSERKLAESLPLLAQASTLVDSCQGTRQQKVYLNVFLLVLQTCHYLLAGQVKCSKSWLKQLQQSVQEISQWPDKDQFPACSTQGDMFMWMPKEELCVVVYLITVMHSMQAGYMDKAQKYSEKALSQISRLSEVDECVGGGRPILRLFQLMILEHVIQCRLVIGDNHGALQQTAALCQMCRTHPSLLTGHRSQVHTIIGLYAMSVGCMDAAESQLNAALRTSQERELWTFINMNLAVVYLRSGRHTEFVALLDRISPDALTASHSHCLRAASFYIQGLHGFFQQHFTDAKRYLRETLKMANAEDLNRLTSCSLVLLGNIFLALGNNRDSFNMVTPAMQLANKIPDVHVQMWAAAVLRDLYRACGDPVKESAELQRRAGWLQTLMSDRAAALSSPHHALISWTDGAVPALTPVTSPQLPSTLPTSSSASTTSSTSSPSAITTTVQASVLPSLSSSSSSNVAGASLMSTKVLPAVSDKCDQLESSPHPSASDQLNQHPLEPTADSFASHRSRHQVYQQEEQHRVPVASSSPAAAAAAVSSHVPSYPSGFGLAPADYTALQTAAVSSTPSPAAGSSSTAATSQQQQHQQLPLSAGFHTTAAAAAHQQLMYAHHVPGHHSDPLQIQAQHQLTTGVGVYGMVNSPQHHNQQQQSQQVHHQLHQSPIHHQPHSHHQHHHLHQQQQQQQEFQQQQAQQQHYGTQALAHQHHLQQQQQQQSQALLSHAAAMGVYPPVAP